ncbi:DUF1573 domain-containing protein [Hymenobacter tibetensis]|jgi:hypothetical protein|uniref:DUF1573 domain-containing protein n=1 Tax=Hymenobacter tibetensis TaxID=497967 RepID=A0ABY4CU27_9BACT|nr:DUF1573 domain-containing protein [Hymenobacter tibetensis]UOG73547.1 DUF1573 domain-containing protein [Hymenobacter tibetensis]
MKKAFVLALSLACAGFAAQAQTAAVKPANAQVKPAGPQIQFDEMKYDFGTAKQGEVVKHVFKFKNVGTQPLVISNIGVSCGCTTPEWTKEPVMPGKTGSITANFNTAGKMGMQNKVLTVESNSAAGNAMVSVVGEVKENAAPTVSAEKTESAAAGEKTKMKMDDSKMKAKKKS